VNDKDIGSLERVTHRPRTFYSHLVQLSPPLEYVRTGASHRPPTGTLLFDPWLAQVIIAYVVSALRETPEDTPTSTKSD
jgi:hypothetical protein